MTPASAAKQFIEADAAYKAANAAREEAKSVLLEHFKKTGTATYKGVQYAVSSFTAIDNQLVRDVLGKRLVDVQVTRTRETLSPIPKAA